MNPFISVVLELGCTFGGEYRSSPDKPSLLDRALAPLFESDAPSFEGAQPYRFYLLERVQAAFAELGEPEQGQVLELLERCDMSPLLDVRLSRRIGRSNNLEVWS